MIILRAQARAMQDGRLDFLYPRAYTDFIPPLMEAAMLDKLAQRGKINILLVLFLILEIGVFPYFSGQIKNASSGQGLLDTSLFLPADQIHAMVAAYGTEGRNIYAINLLSADLLFPLVYGLLLAALIRYLLRVIYPPDDWRQRAVALPFAALACDYAENLNILALLAAYPRPADLLANLLPLVTAVKWLLVLASFGIVVYAIVVYLKRPASRTA